MQLLRFMFNRPHQYRQEALSIPSRARENSNKLKIVRSAGRAISDPAFFIFFKVKDRLKK
jgi:hypothetical protein